MVIGARILDEANVVVALTAYTAALLARAVLEALVAVPAAVRDAATAVGYPGLRRMLAVELPLSLPVLVAGVRVVVATNIAMVAVGAVIGLGAWAPGSPRAIRQTRALRSWPASSRSWRWRSSSTR